LEKGGVESKDLTPFSIEIRRIEMAIRVRDKRASRKEASRKESQPKSKTASLERKISRLEAMLAKKDKKASRQYFDTEIWTALSRTVIKKFARNMSEEINAAVYSTIASSDVEGEFQVNVDWTSELTADVTVDFLDVEEYPNDLEAAEYAFKGTKVMTEIYDDQLNIRIDFSVKQVEV